MDTPSISPKLLKFLSLKVCKLLDDIGASEELRKQCMETAVKEEVIGTVLARLQGARFTCYIFGSSSEGTKTVGLMSDVDHLISQEIFEVCQHENEIKPSDSYLGSLLLVTDPSTKPGYAKLQLALNGILQTDIIPDLGIPPNEIQLDNKGRVIITKRYYWASLEDEEHGPAFSTPAAHGYAAKDMVQAFRCRKWPKAAMKWFERVKDKHWPTKEMVDEMKVHGFFLVPVGHVNSPEKSLEWRISLSQQERKLMMSLNSTQHKCYILLKMIKKDILPTMIGDESLTSYHCKTCLFYVIEETPEYVWTSDNILVCLQNCLQYLLKCVTRGMCPNYFIPEENMFDGRISEETLVKLNVALEKLLASNFKYLLHLKSDDFGERLYENSTMHCEETENPRYQASKLSIYMKIYSQLTVARNAIMDICSSTTPEKVPQAFLDILRGLNAIETIAEQSKEDTKRALNLLTPSFELSLMSLIVVTQASKTAEKDVLWKYLGSGNWTVLRRSSDILSARLKQATLMFMLGFKEESFEILDCMLELISYPSYQVSACYCRKFIPQRDTPDHALEAVDCNFETFHRSNVAPCVVFLPSEAPLFPAALIYEMFRSVGMPPETRHPAKDVWYDWAVVDAKLLLYFLLYLHYKDLNFGLEHVYIIFMENLLLTDSLLGHKETALNLLGWAYNNEGQVDKAFQCFQRSLSLQKFHNAAYWHICMMVNSKINI